MINAHKTERPFYSFLIGLLLLFPPSIAVVAQQEARNAHPYEPPEDPAIQLQIPRYDPDDPEHVLIQSNSDWSRVNDPDKRVFFVAPGDYREAGTIRLTASGDRSAPRWLVYRDPERPEDQTHPYHMKEKKQAFLRRLIVNGGDYWRVDRLRLEQSSRIHDAHHSILNRVLIRNPQFDRSNDPLYIVGGSRHTTVQNSVIANSPFDPGNDVVGIVPVDAPYTRIVSNEIFNMAGDGIQCGPADQTGAIGTEILNNDIYITPRMYTDGNGNLDRNGSHAGAENAIDIKQASVPEQHPVPEEKQLTIAYNRMWGFRPTDTAVGGTGSGGVHLVIHYEPASYVRVHHNIFFDGKGGYNVSKNEQLGPIHHHYVHDNLFWNFRGPAIKPRHIDHSVYQRNIVVDAKRFLGMWFNPPDTVPLNNRVEHNVLLNVPEHGGGSKKLRSKNTIKNNAYYGSEAVQSGADHLQFSDVSDARHRPLEVRVKRITDPETITIPNARVTEDSPHAGWFPDR